jgi:hypothetical protein
VSPRRDEVEAAVDPIVRNVPSVQPSLPMEKLFKLVINVLDNGTETGDRKYEGLD